jgi:hypothetical protein
MSGRQQVALESAGPLTKIVNSQDVVDMLMAPNLLTACVMEAGIAVNSLDARNRHIRRDFVQDMEEALDVNSRLDVLKGQLAIRRFAEDMVEERDVRIQVALKELDKDSTIAWGMEGIIRARFRVVRCQLYIREVTVDNIISTKKVLMFPRVQVWVSACLGSWRGRKGISVCC